MGQYEYVVNNERDACNEFVSLLTFTGQLFFKNVQFFHPKPVTLHLGIKECVESQLQSGCKSCGIQYAKWCGIHVPTHRKRTILLSPVIRNLTYRISHSVNVESGNILLTWFCTRKWGIGHILVPSFYNIEEKTNTKSGSNYNLFVSVV